MRFRFFLLPALFFCSTASAQPIQFSQSTNIPVAVGGQNLPLAWAGGLHAPQFSRIDLNNDGIRDLFVFDRGDRAVLPFLNTGAPGQNSYAYAPQYAGFFPDNLMHWVLLADYNCDGKDDIFTSNTQQGVTVFLNTSQGGNLSFDLQAANLATSTGFQIEVPATDIPAILDIDDDGDLDILAFDFAGTFVVEYRNDQNCGLDYSIGTLCWGQFSENASNSSITLGVNCRFPIPATNSISPEDVLHAGSTLLLIDNNGDGNKDALIGDISSTQMVFLQNSASGQMVAQTTNFPASLPADLFIFPAGFYQDVDNDGLKDLLIAPNTGADPGGKNFDQVLLYKNTGNNASPVFTYQQNDFLENQMLDFGSGSAPAFFDYDADGDLDLLIGNYGYRESSISVVSRLALLRNDGTNAAPSFNLVDSDYLQLSSLSGQFVTDLSPAFGDMDGDGDQDLLIGKNNGELMYYLNTAGAGQPVDFSFVTNTYQNINVGLLSKPHVVDLDRDGLPDLLIGERNGNINYYRNTGTATAPAFTLETQSFGGIDLFGTNFGAGNSTPFIADLDGNGNYDLMVGERLGKVHIYPDIENNITGTFAEAGHTLLLPESGNTIMLNQGLRAAPAAADLNGDGKPDLVIGTLRGGLGLYYNISGLTAAPEIAGLPELTLWPNPAQTLLHFSYAGNTGDNLSVRLFDMLGKELQVPKNTATQGNGYVNISQLPAGMYVLQFATGTGNIQTRKVLKK